MINTPGWTLCFWPDRFFSGSGHRWVRLHLPHRLWQGRGQLSLAVVRSTHWLFLYSSLYLDYSALVAVDIIPSAFALPLHKWMLFLIWLLLVICQDCDQYNSTQFEAQESICKKSSLVTQTRFRELGFAGQSPQDQFTEPTSQQWTEVQSGICSTLCQEHRKDGSKAKPAENVMALLSMLEVSDGDSTEMSPVRRMVAGRSRPKLCSCTASTSSPSITCTSTNLDLEQLEPNGTSTTSPTTARSKSEIHIAQNQGKKTEGQRLSGDTWTSSPFDQSLWCQRPSITIPSGSRITVQCYSSAVYTMASCNQTNCTSQAGASHFSIRSEHRPGDFAGFEIVLPGYDSSTAGHKRDGGESGKSGFESVGGRSWECYQPAQSIKSYPGTNQNGQGETSTRVDAAFGIQCNVVEGHDQLLFHPTSTFQCSHRENEERYEDCRTVSHSTQSQSRSSSLIQRQWRGREHQDRQRHRKREQGTCPTRKDSKSLATIHRPDEGRGCNRCGPRRGRPRPQEKGQICRSTRNQRIMKLGSTIACLWNGTCVPCFKRVYFEDANAYNGVERRSLDAPRCAASIFHGSDVEF